VENAPIYKPMYYDIGCCNVASDNSTSSYFSSTDFYTTPTTVVPEVYDLLT